MGTMLAKKALQGSKTQSRELMEGIKENNMLLTCEAFTWRVNLRFLYKEPTA